MPNPVTTDGDRRFLEGLANYLETRCLNYWTEVSREFAAELRRIVERMQMADRDGNRSNPYHPNAEKCCECCAFGRGEHAEFCLIGRMLREKEEQLAIANEFSQTQAYRKQA